MNCSSLYSSRSCFFADKFHAIPDGKHTRYGIAPEWRLLGEVDTEVCFVEMHVSIS
jgi:hypothetical protein